MTKIEIIQKLNNNVNEFASSCMMMDKHDFFTRVDDKWSPAENSGHLVLSVTPLIIAFSLPGFILRVLFKKPNRQSRSYDTLLQKYKDKLSEGYKASAAYIPKQITTEKEIITVVNTFKRAHQKLISKFEKWKDADLDNYLLPHPLLGKLTLREMMYFTILHVDHHDQAVKKYNLIESN